MLGVERRFLGVGKGCGWRRCSGGRRRTGLLAIGSLKYRKGLAKVGFRMHRDAEWGLG